MITIDGFPIDAAIAITPQFENEVTDHPVEEGADVTDHVRARPLIVTLECVVSDTPIGEIARERERSGFLPSDDALAKLQDIHLNREPITIETDLHIFSNMVLLSLSTPQDARTGDSLRFRAVFKQIELVSNDRTIIAVELPRVQKKQRRGNKQSAQVKADAVRIVATNLRTVAAREN